MEKKGQDVALSAAERAALRRYTEDGDFVGRLNRALRDSESETVERHAGLVSALNATLDRLPDHPGEVRRGIKVVGEAKLRALQRRYAEDNEVVENGFTSATLLPDVPDAYRNNVLFVIQSRHGKAIERWSVKPEEREVLFKTGTAFRVNRADWANSPGGRHIIWMTEVDDGDEQ